MSNEILLTPEQIKVDPKQRGRRFAPTKDDVVHRAISLHQNGQLQPVEVYEQEGEYHLVFGFTRHDAVRMLRAGFEAGGNTYHDPDFLLRAQVVKVSSQRDARLRNIRENQERSATSPIDDAYNMASLRDEHAMTQAEVGAFYFPTAKSENSSTVKVNQTLKLLKLDTNTQKLVHAGKLGVQAALKLLKIEDEDERQAIIDKARKEGGGISGAEITRALREIQLAVQEEKVEEAAEDEEEQEQEQEQEQTQANPLSRKEVKEFFMGENGPGSDPAVRRFCTDFLAWYDGLRTHQQMVNALRRLLRATEAEETEETEEEEAA